MKQLKKTATKVWFTIVAFFAGTLFVLAQDNAGSSVTTTHTTTETWYASPWVWIVGAAVFILILVALLRGGGSKTTITRTTTTESDV